MLAKERFGTVLLVLRNDPARGHPRKPFSSAARMAEYGV
jgi:hypothetical protein